jgi:hypothetical protein
MVKTPAQPQSLLIPPLENGDRLTRPEFERRYSSAISSAMIDWFHLQEGMYVPLPMDENGVIRSQTFPGLWLAVNDLLAGNKVQVLAVLQAGLASPEHAAFVQQLSATEK